MSSSDALAVFRDFLVLVLLTHFDGSHTALAEAVGIDARSLRRTMNPTEGKHTFSLEHCLRLAQALRGATNASYVLHKADKAEMARLLEGLYGRPRLSETEEELLDVWSGLDAAHQDVLLAWAKQTAAVLARARPAPQRRRRRYTPRRTRPSRKE